LQSNGNFSSMAARNSDVTSIVCLYSVHEMVSVET